MVRLMRFNQGDRHRIKEIAPGVWGYTLSSPLLRRAGFCSSFYRVDDLLIDTSFAHGREQVLNLVSRPPLAIALTHHHEDHQGNAATLQERQDCPVYLHRPELRRSEGLDAMPFYRRLWWGESPDFEVSPMPKHLDTGRRQLEVLYTPGHSATHAVFFDPVEGLAFVGDLYLTAGVTAVMEQERPLELAQSLEALAHRKPRRLLNGHDLDLPHPELSLRSKARRLREACEKVQSWRKKGMSLAQIQSKLFQHGRWKDRYLVTITRGEFARKNFVLACLEC